MERAVREAVDSGRETGVQVAVARAGEIVFECAAGLADVTTGRPVDAETLFPIFSATKGIAATAVHVQAERGLLDYERPVSDYWPEFRAPATVRQALAHRAGVPQMPEGTTVERMCDWDGMAAAVAALEPLWAPGTRMGYHAYTFGWIVGELVRRTDPAARSIGRFVREEIAPAAGAADLWIGIPDAVESRIARLEEGREAVDAPEGSLLLRAIPAALGTTQAVFGRPDVRRSEHPAAGGIASARSLARMYALLAAGGGPLLSPERVEQAAAVACAGEDVVMGRPVARGLGYWVAGEPAGASSAPMGPDPASFGHPGAGCSIGWADRGRGVGIALLKNRMLAPATPADNPLTAIAEAIRDALDAR